MVKTAEKKMKIKVDDKQKPIIRMSTQKRKTDYVPEASKIGTHYNLCFNFDQMEFHLDEAAQFYCLRERAFLCEVCFEAHRAHVG